MNTQKRETMSEFAQRAIHGFKVQPYDEVDKNLREGVKETVAAYKARSEKILDFMEKSVNGKH